MSEPAERRQLWLPSPLYDRITRVRDEMRASTGRPVTLAEVVERAFDRAAMEEDQ